MSLRFLSYNSILEKLLGNKKFDIFFFNLYKGFQAKVAFIIFVFLGMSIVPYWPYYITTVDSPNNYHLL